MKILVIGCGSIGQRHIRNLVLIKTGKILAFDINKQKLKEVKHISKSIVLSHKLDTLWREKPEAVFITTPTALHLPYALKAAKRGCHLFIEKPLSHNIHRIDELIKIVRQKRLITFIGYNYRFNDCVVKIKELLNKMAIGKIIAGKTHFGSYLPERHPWEDYRLGYGAKKSLGGGVLLDALSHHLDILIFLFGEPEAVFSYLYKGSKLKIDVEDVAEVLLKFSKDTVINIHANFVQRPVKSGLEFIADKGTIYCDLIKSIVRRYDINGRKWMTYYGDKDPNKVYIREIKYFIKCIKDKIPPLVNISRARKELDILMKIRESSLARKWIKV